MAVFFDDVTQARSLYQQALGAGFALLPAPLRAFHGLQGTHVLRGVVRTAAPSGFAARCLGWCLGVPQSATQGPIRFELRADASSESWTRCFPGKTMVSRFTLRQGRVIEHLGAARLGFVLGANREGLKMHLVELRFLALPCPRWLMPKIVAEETATEGRLHFQVRASLPLLGDVANYSGYLDVPERSAL